MKCQMSVAAQCCQLFQFTEYLDNEVNEKEKSETIKINKFLLKVSCVKTFLYSFLPSTTKTIKIWRPQRKNKFILKNMAMLLSKNKRSLS